MAVDAQTMYMQGPVPGTLDGQCGGVLSDARCDALNRFLKSVERRAFHIALMGTRQREDALDVVQEAMLRFAKSYAHKPAAEWPPLFYRVLSTRLTDWYRRQSVRRRWSGWLTFPGREDDSDPFNSVADPAAMDPQRRLQSDELGASLRDALQQLPNRQREAFLLRSWEGFSVAETATAMGCSEGSVKTHLSRAMAAMRTALQEDYHA